MKEEDYKELTELLLEQSEYLNHIATHANRFNIVLSKMNDFMLRIKVYPPELEHELQNILEQLGETSLLIGSDFAELGKNGQTFIKNLRKVMEK